MTERRPNRILGPLHDPFWHHCDREQLALQRCMSCEHRPWPPVATCEQCGSDSLRWEPVSGQGKLLSWCRFDHDYYLGAMPMPYWNIVVELDEGPIFISNPSQLDQSDFVAGLPLRVSFQQCEDEHGPFRLPVFGPLTPVTPQS